MKGRVHVGGSRKAHQVAEAIAGIRRQQHALEVIVRKHERRVKKQNTRGFRIVDRAFGQVQKLAWEIDSGYAGLSPAEHAVAILGLNNLYSVVARKPWLSKSQVVSLMRQAKGGFLREGDAQKAVYDWVRQRLYLFQPFINFVGAKNVPSFWVEALQKKGSRRKYRVS